MLNWYEHAWETGKQVWFVTHTTHIHKLLKQHIEGKGQQQAKANNRKRFPLTLSSYACWRHHSQPVRQSISQSVSNLNCPDVTKKYIKAGFGMILYLKYSHCKTLLTSMTPLQTVLMLCMMRNPLRAIHLIRIPYDNIACIKGVIGMIMGYFDTGNKFWFDTCTTYIHKIVMCNSTVSTVW